MSPTELSPADGINTPLQLVTRMLVGEAKNSLLTKNSFCIMVHQSRMSRHALPCQSGVWEHVKVGGVNLSMMGGREVLGEVVG